jgi:hypothetical protein
MYELIWSFALVRVTGNNYKAHCGAERGDDRSKQWIIYREERGSYIKSGEIAHGLFVSAISFIYVARLSIQHIPVNDNGL